MTGYATGLPRPGTDMAVAAVSVTLLGCCAVLGLAAGATGAVPLAVAAGVGGAGALLVLLAAGWLDSMVFLALVLPLPALYSTEALRLSTAALATPLVVFAALVGGTTSGRRLRLGTLPRKTTLLLLAAVLTATIFADNRILALRELVNWALFVALLVVATDYFMTRPARIRSVAMALATVAGLTGFLAVAESAGLLPGRFPLPGSGLFRASLGFGWPNELAMFLALCIPFSVFAVQSAHKGFGRSLAVAGLITAVLGLAATFSRGSWLGLVAASAILLLVGERKLVVRIGVAVVAAALIVDILTGGVLRARVVGTATDPYVVQRAALTLTGLLIFRAHPFVGVGPGGFVEALDDFGPRVTWLWDYVGTAHNAYVDVAAEMGSIGLVAFVAFLGGSLLILLRAARGTRDRSDRSRDEARLRTALLWSFATACLVSFAAWPFAHGIGQVIMLVAAMGFALDGIHGGARERR